MIAKRFKTYVPWELRPFLGENTLFFKEGAFLPKDLGPSPRKIHCSLGKFYFSPGIFLTLWGTCLGLTFSLLLRGEVTS
jgi:hypothetical protein